MRKPLLPLSPRLRIYAGDDPDVADQVALANARSLAVTAYLNGRIAADRRAEQTFAASDVAAALGISVADVLAACPFAVDDVIRVKVGKADRTALRRP